MITKYFSLETMRLILSNINLQNIINGSRFEQLWFSPKEALQRQSKNQSTSNH